MSKRGPQLISENYNARKNARRMLDFYQRVIEETRRM
jgi:hypothetical protein